MHHHVYMHVKQSESVSVWTNSNYHYICKCMGLVCLLVCLWACYLWQLSLASAPPLVELLPATPCLLLVPDSRRAGLFPALCLTVSPVWLRQGPFEGRLRLILPPRSASASSVYHLAQVRLDVTLPVGEMSRQEESIWTASVDTHALWNTCEQHKPSPSPTCAVLKILPKLVIYRFDRKDFSCNVNCTETLSYQFSQLKWWCCFNSMAFQLNRQIFVIGYLQELKTKAEDFAWQPVDSRFLFFF